MRILREAAAAAREKQSMPAAVDPSTREADLKLYETFVAADPFVRLTLMARSAAAIERGALAAQEPPPAPAATPETTTEAVVTPTENP